MKRVSAVVLAAALLAGCASSKPVSVQQRANDAAAAAAPMIAAAQNGTDMSKQGAALVSKLEAQTKCKVIDARGGVIPADTRSDFLKGLDASMKAYIAANPHSVIGHYEGPTFGVIIILNCPTAPA